MGGDVCWVVVSVGWWCLMGGGVCWVVMSDGWWCLMCIDI